MKEAIVISTHSQDPSFWEENDPLFGMKWFMPSSFQSSERTILLLPLLKSFEKVSFHLQLLRSNAHAESRTNSLCTIPAYFETYFENILSTTMRTGSSGSNLSGILFEASELGRKISTAQKH
jgi:hypothetical protein